MYSFLVESVPEAQEDLSRVKMLLSQGLAIVFPASLKISGARSKFSLFS